MRDLSPFYLETTLTKEDKGEPDNWEKVLFWIIVIGLTSGMCWFFISPVYNLFFR